MTRSLGGTNVLYFLVKSVPKDKPVIPHDESLIIEDSDIIVRYPISLRVVVLPLIVSDMASPIIFLYAEASPAVRVQTLGGDFLH